MKKIFFGVLLALLSGCSTQPVSNMQASDVPSERIWDKQIVKKTDNKGTIIVKRDSGFLGSACLTSIYIDGNPVADIGTREKVTFYSNPGRHVLSATPHGWCAGGMVETSADVVKDNVLTYRVGYGANGDFRLSPTAF
jgi:hypothetical protein